MSADKNIYHPSNADYSSVESGVRHTVWLPGTVNPTGMFEVDSRGAFSDAKDKGDLFLFNGVRSLEQFQRCTPLGPVLRYLGIKAEIKYDNHYQLKGVARMTFPLIQEIVDRADQLNRTLPTDHKLPIVEWWPGDFIPARDYLGIKRDDALLLADGAGTDKESPIYPAHDLSYHLPSQLAQCRGTRNVLNNLAGAVLSLPDPTHLFSGGPTIRGLYTGLFDGYDSALHMGPEHFALIDEPHVFNPSALRGSTHMLGQLASDFQIHEINKIIPGDVFTPPSRQERLELGAACREHVAFLGSHAESLRV